MGEDSSRSPSLMLPARSGSKPAIARRTVVLPQPEGPRRQPMRPAPSDTEKPSTPACAFVGEAHVLQLKGSAHGLNSSERAPSPLRASRITGNSPAATMASAAIAPSS